MTPEPPDTYHIRPNVLMLFDLHTNGPEKEKAHPNEVQTHNNNNNNNNNNNERMFGLKRRKKIYLRKSLYFSYHESELG